MRSPKGASAALLRLALDGQVSMLLSVALAIEYEAKCRLPEHRLASGLDQEEVDVFVTAVIALAEPVENYFLWRPQLRDAADEMVLEAAVNGRADALVTYNIRDFGTVPVRFGMELLKPADVLRRFAK